MPCPVGEFFDDHGPGEDCVSDDGAEADAGGLAVRQVMSRTEYSSSVLCCLICHFRVPLRCYFFLTDAEFVGGFCSFYIHRSSRCLIAPENAHHPDNPLRGLFKLLRRFGVPEV
jgi:hypothetical protein